MSEKGILHCETIGLGLQQWQGGYQGIEAVWLRWVDAKGELLPTRDELLVQEQEKRQQEYQRAEQERQRADHLAAHLRSLGVDPEIL